MVEIRLPKLNTNDTSYVLVEWCVADGAAVSQGAPVVVVETSKAAEEIVAPADGFVRWAAPVGAECTVGQIVGHVLASAEERPPVAVGAPADGGLIVTAPAQALIDQLGLDPGRLLELGKRVIRRADVESLAATDASAGVAVDVIPLSRQQRRVAEIVSRSHASIPAAFTSLWVDAAAAGRVRRDLQASTQATVGVTEMLIKVAAALREGYPRFFGSFQEDYTIAVPAGVRFGVTIDVGTGLYLPVVRDPATTTVVRIAQLLDTFRAKARTGAFREADLSGANIALSLGTYTGVWIMRPIIFPGMTCMLSLTATHNQQFALGIAYDHRANNGRDAVVFLREIKSVFEHETRLAGLAFEGLVDAG